MEEKTCTVYLKNTLIKYSSARLWSVYNQIWNVPEFLVKLLISYLMRIRLSVLCRYTRKEREI
jgi:hypothetical protein